MVVTYLSVLQVCRQGHIQEFSSEGDSPFSPLPLPSSPLPSFPFLSSPLPSPPYPSLSSPSLISRPP